MSTYRRKNVRIIFSHYIISYICIEKRLNGLMHENLANYLENKAKNFSSRQKKPQNYLATLTEVFQKSSKDTKLTLKILWTSYRSRFRLKIKIHTQASDRWKRSRRISKFLSRFSQVLNSIYWKSNQLNFIFSDDFQ